MKNSGLKTRKTLTNVLSMNGTTKLILSTFVLFSMLVVGCRKKASWDADWVLPLVNDRLDISKFVNDSTIEEDNGYYALNFKRNLYNFNLTDIVGIPDTTIDRTTSLNISSLSVNPGFEFFNSIEEHELNLQDLELKIIQLEGGSISFELSNPVATGIFITVELPGVSKDGVTLSKTFFINGGSLSNPSKINESISLKDYQIDLRGTSGNSFNKLQSRVKIKTDPDGSSVNVTNQHSFNIKAKFQSVKLKYARGYFGQRILEETKDFNIDFFNNVVAGMIDIPNTSIKLTLENGIKIDGRGIINYLKNKNNQGNEVLLSGLGTYFTVDEPTGSYSALVPSTHVMTFNSGNSNVEEFIENLGAKNDISYKIQINPWGNTSGGWNEVYPQSRLRLMVEAQMPLSIKMDALTIRDTFDFKMDQNKDKSHLASGVVQLDLDNGFPFAAKVKLLFLDENGTLIETTQGSQSIESSLFGQLNNQGLMHKTSTVEIPLNSSVIDQLNVIKKIAVEAVFDTPGGVGLSNQMVSIPVDAFFGVKAKAKFKLKLKV